MSTGTRAFKMTIFDARVHGPRPVATARGHGPWRRVGLVCTKLKPASFATAERNFSSLRRLKTYLQSTCGHRQLNNIAFCHVHRHIFNEMNVRELIKEFVLGRDSRAAVFRTHSSSECVPTVAVLRDRSAEHSSLNVFMVAL